MMFLKIALGLVFASVFYTIVMFSLFHDVEQHILPKNNKHKKP